MALARPELPALAVATVCLFVSAGLGLAVPRAIQAAIDSLGSGQTPITPELVGLGALGLAVYALASMGRTWLFTLAGERIVRRLRNQLFGRLVHQPISTFDQQRTGDLLSRLSSDTAAVQTALTVDVSHALRQLIPAVGGIALLAWMAPRLALVMAVLLPAVGIGTAWYGRRLRRDSRALADAHAEASSVASEVLGAIRTVRSFAREDWATERYGRHLDHGYEVARHRARATGVFVAVSQGVRLGAVALVVLLGVQEVAAGRLGLGALGAFLLYATMVAFSLGTLATLWGSYMRAMGATERVFAWLDTPEAATGGERPAGVRGALLLDGVDFAYPSRSDRPALRGVHLHVRAGECVALVGASGSGKSTVAALVSRLYDPDRGGLSLDDRPFTDLDPSWLREQVGVVSQEPVLFGASIAANLRLGRPDATDDELIAAAQAANALGFIEAFPDGFATEVGERGIALSGGQKQRIAIARALLKDPAVLILDEATSALDAESEHQVKQAIDRLMVGRTTLIIAHRLSTVRAADRIVVLHQGAVVEVGSHHELLHRQGAYAALVHRQNAA